jgi:acetylornithine deacetylase
LLGRGSVHASLIGGGVEMSSYPARCTIGIERRTLPGMSVADVEAELDSLLERCRRADHELAVERHTLLAREPFEVEPNAEVVTEVRAAAVLNGVSPAIEGASYWADSGFIAAAGIPTVLFGPSGAGAHETEEWVSISDTETVARTLVATARRLCA